MNEKDEKKDDIQGKESDESTSSQESSEQEAKPPWESELDFYPLKKPQEDPRWAVRTVGCWIGIALASLVFILTLLILGLFYD